MPGGDKAGPMGAGPMTGRGVGICSGNDVPGSKNPSNERFGRGLGRCRGVGIGRGSQGGRGRGRRHQYYATEVPGTERGYDSPNPAVSQGSDKPASSDTAQAEELEQLKKKTRQFKGALEDIEKRASELQREAKNTNEVQQNEEEKE